MTARAAPAIWPYLDHRTVAELDVIADAGRAKGRQRFIRLDSISRQRALTDDESAELERLLRWAA